MTWKIHILITCCYQVKKHFCWWKKSCTSLVSPIIYELFTSQVVHDFLHQPYLYQPRVCLDYLQFARPTFGWNNWPPWGWSSPSQIESHPAQSWTSIGTNGVKLPPPWSRQSKNIMMIISEDFFNLAVASANTCRCRFTFWPLPFLLGKKRCKYHLSVGIANRIESNQHVRMSFQPLGATSRHIPRLSQTYPLEVDNPNLGQTAGVILSMQSWKLLLLSSVFWGCWKETIEYFTLHKYMICIYSCFYMVFVGGPRPQKCHVTLASFRNLGNIIVRKAGTHKQSSISEVYYFGDLA